MRSLFMIKYFASLIYIYINILSHLHLYYRILMRFNEILNYHSTLKFIMRPAVFEGNLNK